MPEVVDVQHAAVQIQRAFRGHASRKDTFSMDINRLSGMRSLRSGTHEERSALQGRMLWHELQNLKYFNTTVDPELGIRLLQIADLQSYEPGEKLCIQGADPDCFHILMEGEADAFLVGIDEPVARFAKGDAFGELSLVNDEKRAATVVAAGPDPTVTLVIDKFFYMKIMKHLDEKELQEKMQTLVQTTEFKDIPNAKLHKLANSVRRVHWLPTHELACQGEPAKEVHVLVAGDCRVLHRNAKLSETGLFGEVDSRPARPICVATLMPFLVIGGSESLQGGRHNATIVAGIGGTTTLSVKSTEFVQLMEDPCFSIVVEEILPAAQRFLEQRIERAVLSRTKSRRAREKSLRVARQRKTKLPQVMKSEAQTNSQAFGREFGDPTVTFSPRTRKPGQGRGDQEPTRIKQPLRSARPTVAPAQPLVLQTSCAESFSLFPIEDDDECLREAADVFPATPPTMPSWSSRAGGSPRKRLVKPVGPNRSMSLSDIRPPEANAGPKWIFTEASAEIGVGMSGDRVKESNHPLDIAPATDLLGKAVSRAFPQKSSCSSDFLESSEWQHITRWPHFLRVNGLPLIGKTTIRNTLDCLLANFSTQPPTYKHCIWLVCDGAAFQAYVHFSEQDALYEGLSRLRRHNLETELCSGEDFSKVFMELLHVSSRQRPPSKPGKPGVRPLTESFPVF